MQLTIPDDSFDPGGPVNFATGVPSADTGMARALGSTSSDALRIAALRQRTRQRAVTTERDRALVDGQLSVLRGLHGERDASVPNAPWTGGLYQEDADTYISRYEAGEVDTWLQDAEQAFDKLDPDVRDEVLVSWLPWAEDIRFQAGKRYETLQRGTALRDHQTNLQQRIEHGSRAAFSQGVLGSMSDDERMFVDEETGEQLPRDPLTQAYEEIEAAHLSHADAWPESYDAVGVEEQIRFDKSAVVRELIQTYVLERNYAAALEVFENEQGVLTDQVRDGAKVSDLDWARDAVQKGRSRLQEQEALRAGFAAVGGQPNVGRGAAPIEDQRRDYEAALKGAFDATGRDDWDAFLKIGREKWGEAMAAADYDQKQVYDGVVAMFEEGDGYMSPEQLQLWRDEAPLDTLTDAQFDDLTKLSEAWQGQVAEAVYTQTAAHLETLYVAAMTNQPVRDRAGEVVHSARRAREMYLQYSMSNGTLNPLGDASDPTSRAFQVKRRQEFLDGKMSKLSTLHADVRATIERRTKDYDDEKAAAIYEAVLRKGVAEQLASGAVIMGADGEDLYERVTEQTVFTGPFGGDVELRGGADSLLEVDAISDLIRREDFTSGQWEMVRTALQQGGYAPTDQNVARELFRMVYDRQQFDNVARGLAEEFDEAFEEARAQQVTGDYENERLLNYAGMPAEEADAAMREALVGSTIREILDDQEGISSVFQKYGDPSTYYDYRRKRAAEVRSILERAPAEIRDPAGLVEFYETEKALGEHAERQVAKAERLGQFELRVNERVRRYLDIGWRPFHREQVMRMERPDGVSKAEHEAMLLRALKLAEARRPRD